MTGELATVVETRLVDELAPPRHPLVGDASWVRPGRAAWSWWSDFYSGAQLDAQKHFVDVAAEFGWEHLLIDCGWEETWVPEIVAYAAGFGIQVHLWTVWHDLDGAEKLQKLALWRSWGVAGIKVDFMESESKDRYRWYDSVLAETARLGLMVNFHGSVIPRGWARTWPQVVGYEAIRGSEYYVFYNDLPLTAGHNVIQPFTRNVVGAMDYTPVAFTAPDRTTSDGHELGLSVAFESGITNFADGVDAYRDRPLAARLLTELPSTWDETRQLAGTPDTEAVIARRSGDRWFLGGIATGAARTLEIPLARLGGGRRRAWVVTDLPGGEGHGLTETDSLVENTLVVDVGAEGGFAAVLAPVGTELFRAAAAELEPAPSVEPSLGELDAAGRASVTTEPGASVRVPPGWQAEQRDATTWIVTAPDSLAGGALGVIAVEKPGRRGIPLVAHARLVKPLTRGSEVVLSTLPMLDFQNENGPVERDQSNGGGNPADGQRMRVADAEFDHGFGVSTPSAFRIALGGRAERLTGFAGVDDETPGTTAVAIVEADGRELLRLTLAAGADPIAFEVDLAGAGILTLRTERRPGDEPVPFTRAPHSFESGAPDAAHVDWAALVLTTPPLHHSDAITSRDDH
ncbi:glycoside hydrolase family 97 catalytic domain-containing protein [Herbiconiux sp. UC225_62]|uniref:glycoside hydrolase family 97 catalytic domain-containing protein n=1 Tax=Herbiconiux sp. UC225_62 TaxID=3350168 RepID=UPI0036D40B66